MNWNRKDALRIREIISRMGLCSCGSNAHWIIVKKILEEADHHGMDKGFYTDNWWEFGAKVLDSWRLLEHGTGIGYAWLTEDGKMLLQFLDDFGVEDHDFNSGSGHPMWSIEFSWDDKENPSDTFGEWQRSIKKT